MARPTVFVCRGSHCRRRSAYPELCARLSVVADVSDVRCQRICDGPVVGVPVNGALEWFERVASEKAQRQIVELVSEGGRIRRTLEKRLVAKRSGRLR
jgi:hypothetical protein